MTVDAHVHFYDPAMGDYSWPRKNSPYYRSFLPRALAREAGDALTLCVAIGCADEAELNRRVLALAETDPLIGAFIAQIDPNDPDCARLAGEYAASPLYRGFRVSAGDALAHPDRIPPMLAPGTVVELIGGCAEVGRAAEAISAYPDAVCVLEHFAGALRGEPEGETFRRYCQKLAALPNTVMKLSGIFGICPPDGDPAKDPAARAVFDAAYDAFGPERCMFGSDWPVCGVAYRRTADAIREMAGEGARDVMSATALRVYRIAPPAGEDA